MSFFYFSYGPLGDLSLLKGLLPAEEAVHIKEANSSPALVKGLRLSFSAVSKESPRLGLLNVTPEAPHRADVDLSKYRHAAPPLLPHQSPAPLGGTVYGVVHELPLSVKPFLLEAVGQEGSYNLVSDQTCELVGSTRTVTAVVIAAFDIEVLERQFELQDLASTWKPLPPLQHVETSLEKAFADPIRWGTGRWPGSHWCNFASSFHLLPSPTHLQEVQRVFDQHVTRAMTVPSEYLTAYAALTGPSLVPRDIAKDEKEAKTWYLGYGSNLSWEQVCVRIGPAYQRRPVKLDQYVLVPNKSPYSAEYASFGYYNVEPVRVRREKEAAAEKCNEHITKCVMPDYVCGAAYEMSVSQLEMMDQFELQYRRELHQCVDLHTGETRECWVYIAETTNDCLLPSKEYLGRVLEGRDILPPEYIQGIESTQTNPQRSPRQEKRLRKEL